MKKATLIKLINPLLQKLRPYRTIAVISDCLKDENGRGRVATEISQRFGHSAAALIAVEHTLEASLNILDQLRVGAEIILANIAPRDKADGKAYKNGAHFGYFWIHKSLVVSTISGFTLSLVKKFNLTPKIRVLDLEKSVDLMVREGLISEEEGEEIKQTQFRSCFFQPLAAKAILDGIPLPYTEMSIEDIPDAGLVICSRDCFGNLKTTVEKGQLRPFFDPTEGEMIETELGTFPFHTRLCDVPEGKTALVVGSSGFVRMVDKNTSPGMLCTLLGPNNFPVRLIEIVTKGKAVRKFTAPIGARVFKSKYTLTYQPSNKKPTK